MSSTNVEYDRGVEGLALEANKHYQKREGKRLCFWVRCTVCGRGGGFQRVGGKIAGLKFFFGGRGGGGG